MKLGFFTMPIHPLEKDWRQSLKEDREAFLLADELGFSEAYVGEHTTDRAENITSCVAFIAWLAAATRQIKLGTGTVNLPNSHPAAVAASIAMPVPSRLANDGWWLCDRTPLAPVIIPFLNIERDSMTNLAQPEPTTVRSWINIVSIRLAAASQAMKAMQEVMFSALSVVCSPT